MTGLLALLQAAVWTVAPAAPTVGDTIRLVRHVTAPPGVEARVPPLEATEVIVPLAPPAVGAAEGTLTIVYTVAAFAPGTHTLTPPAVEMLLPDGRVERLDGGRAVVPVRAVLPRGTERPAPRPSLGPVARHPRAAGPLVGLLGAALGGVALWGVGRRRTRRRRPPLEASELAPAVPIDRWVAAGEPRAVAAVTSERVRSALAQLVPAVGVHLAAEDCLVVLRRERPDWPLGELADLLRSLERARFAPAVPSDVMTVVDRAELLLESLEREHGR